MRSLPVVLIVSVLMLACLPAVTDASDASSVTVENKRVLITNVYGSKFISLGTLDESEHSNSGMYFFIEGSERHDLFKRYLDGAVRLLPNDDWKLIREGTEVHAYFFDSNVYQEWHTLITFEDSSGNIRFKSIPFSVERPIDSLDYFFLSGSTARIQWKNMESVAVTAYFNDAEMKLSDTSIPIENNGAYSLKFVIASNKGDTIATTISYTVDGYDDSSSMPIGTVCWVLALISLAGILLLRRGPGWSGKGGLS